MTETFTALRVHSLDGDTHVRFEELTMDDIDEGTVVIRAAYAGVGYRDAMTAKGVGKNIRTDRPCVGGVDVSGVVEKSADPRYRPGDPVLVTNYGLGITHDGAFAEYVRVPSEWIVPLPGGLSLRDAMVLGSSGLTAALAFDRLQAGGVSVDKGQVIVTGATGGVGSLAIDMLSAKEYEVAAVTGKPDAAGYLQDLGAQHILSRSSILEQPKLLGTARWAGAVDNVAGPILDRIAATMLPHGRIAVCGLAADYKLSTTVLPFILRGVDFLGINVGRTLQMPERLRLWSRLAGDLRSQRLDRIATLISFDELPSMLDLMYRGSVTGRVVVDFNRNA